MFYSAALRDDQIGEMYRMGAGAVDCAGARGCPNSAKFLSVGCPAGGSLIFTHIPFGLAYGSCSPTCPTSSSSTTLRRRRIGGPRLVDDARVGAARSHAVDRLQHGGADDRAHLPEVGARAWTRARRRSGSPRACRARCSSPESRRLTRSACPPATAASAASARGGGRRRRPVARQPDAACRPRAGRAGCGRARRSTRGDQGASAARRGATLTTRRRASPAALTPALLGRARDSSWLRLSVGREGVQLWRQPCAALDGRLHEREEALLRGGAVEVVDESAERRRCLAAEAAPVARSLAAAASPAVTARGVASEEYE